MRSICIMLMAIAWSGAAQAGYLHPVLTQPATMYLLVVLAMAGLAWDEYGRKRK